MNFVITVTSRETGEIKNEMVKDFGEYSEWLRRAVLRGYMVMTGYSRNYVYVEGGEGENDFRVEMVER